MNGDNFISVIFWLTCVSMWAPESIEGNRVFTLGGLFPVHGRGQGPESCGALMLNKGIQGVEAMLYAIETINKDPEYSKFTLKADIVDTCYNNLHAVNQSHKFLRKRDCSDSTHTITGIIGPWSSSVAVPVAILFNFFKIPQISYAATTVELDDVVHFPYFFRVLPSDRHKVEAIAALLQKLNLPYVSTVAVRGQHGENAVQELKSLDATKNVCFEESVTIPAKATREEYSNTIQRLLKVDLAKVVVAFLSEVQLKKLFQAAKDTKATRGRLLWILGDYSLGRKYHILHGVEDAAEGALTILPLQSPVKEFDEYFHSRNPNIPKEDVWLKEFWEDLFNCSFNELQSTRRICSGKEDITEHNYSQELLVPAIVDAVYVMAHALKAMCDELDLCGNPSAPVPGDTLRRYIEKVSFQSVRSPEIRIRFDSHRHGPEDLVFYQFRKNSSSGVFGYVHVASWNEKGLNLRTDQQIETYGSVCTNSCGTGLGRSYVQKDKECCWSCIKCNETEYLPPSTGQCTPCKEYYVLNNDATECFRVEPEYFGKDLSESWSLIPFLFAFLGIICSVVMYAAFWIYRDTPIIMASGRELCIMIFLGVFLCYCFTFAMTSRPTKFSCGVVRVGLGLGLVICNSAIFTKSNRISRIFNRKRTTIERPKYVKPKSQVLIVLFFTMTELTLSVIWLIVEPSTVTTDQPNKKKPPMEKCKMDDETVCIGLVLNMALVILCSIYAYKTRKMPENFNEAKYISFAMYSMCIIWMAFLPTFFSLSNGYKLRSMLLTMSVSLSGTVALFCIFIPKLHIAVFHPEKNIRTQTGSSPATTLHSTGGSAKRRAGRHVAQ